MSTFVFRESVKIVIYNKLIIILVNGDFKLLFKDGMGLTARYYRFNLGVFWIKGR